MNKEKWQSLHTLIINSIKVLGGFNDIMRLYFKRV